MDPKRVAEIEQLLTNRHDMLHYNMRALRRAGLDLLAEMRNKEQQLRMAAKEAAKGCCPYDTNYKDRCDITEEVIEDLSATCDDWEPNNEVLREMQDDELKALRKERDELQAQVKERELTIEKIEAKCCQCHAEHVAQVAVLRGALESLVKIYITNKGTENQFVACITPPHGTPAYWKNAINALDSTPAEAAERVRKLVEALEGIEQSGAGTLEGVVVLTQEAKLARQALAEWRHEK